MSYSSFQESLQLAEIQSIDEHMITFKRHNNMKQYMKNYKVGFQSVVYMLH